MMVLHATNVFRTYRVAVWTRQKVGVVHIQLEPDQTASVPPRVTKAVRFCYSLELTVRSESETDKITLLDEEYLLARQAAFLKVHNDTP
jgi:hypothetical protein